MTVHSDIFKALKARYPNAFTPSKPQHYKPDIGIVDGHIALMGAGHTSASSWEQFLASQFLRPIKHLYMNGCRGVVLMFDNRFAVPGYKGMTQNKRQSKYEEVAFGPHDQLPSEIPANLMPYLLNRHFKDKLISFVCERIQSLVKPDKDHYLIVDFKGPPKLYVSEHECPQDIHGLPELGESDVKFTRWVHCLGNAIIHATDGDYVMIALLYYASHGMRPDNNILMYRQLSNTATPAQQAAARKQAVAAGEKAQRQKRQMEYLNIQPFLYNMLECMGLPPDPNPKHIMAVVTTFLLAGTDYSRGIPLVGPRKIVDMGPELIDDMLDAIDVIDESHSLCAPKPTKMLDGLVRKIYSIAFAKNIHSRPPTAAALLEALHASTMAERNKSLLPTINQLDVTCRNVAWVVHYWSSCINCKPDETQSVMYGFVYDDSIKQYTWCDIANYDKPTTMLQLMDPTTLLTAPIPTQLDGISNATKFITEYLQLPPPAKLPFYDPMAHKNKTPLTPQPSQQQQNPPLRRPNPKQEGSSRVPSRRCVSSFFVAASSKEEAKQQTHPTPAQSQNKEKTPNYAQRRQRKRPRDSEQPPHDASDPVQEPQAKVQATPPQSPQNPPPVQDQENPRETGPVTGPVTVPETNPETGDYPTASD